MLKPQSPNPPIPPLVSQIVTLKGTLTVTLIMIVTLIVALMVTFVPTEAKETSRVFAGLEDQLKSLQLP